jgi:putative hydrolase of HD superfamily
MTRMSPPDPATDSATDSATARLARQIAFVVELDKLKQVLRQTVLIDRSRQENDAEHSWHLTAMVLVLGEYAAPGVDLLRVLEMLVIHDVVEIDAGDTFLYDRAGADGQAAREERAADRLYGMLPTDQGAALRALWREFEAGETPDARFARALDRLQPLLHNYYTEGAMWRAHGVRAADVLAKKAAIERGSPALWRYAEDLIRECIAKGWLAA